MKRIAILLAAIVVFAYGCSSTKEIVLKVQQKPPRSSTPGIIAPPVLVKYITTVGSVAYKTSLSIHNGKAVVGSSDGTIYMINLKSDQSKQIKQLGEPIQATCFFTGHYIYVGTLKGTLLKLTLSGKTVWKINIGYPIVGTITMCDNHLYVTTENNGIYSINPQTGSIQWQFSKAYNMLSIRGASSALCYRNNIYVGFNDGTVGDIANGNEIWETPISSKVMFSDVDTKLQTYSGSLYAISTAGKMACINPTTGNIVWEKDISGYSNIAKTFFALFVADNNGTIYAIDPTGGDVIWSKKLSNLYNIYSIYATRDGSVVYAMLGNGTIVAMNAMNGKIMDIKRSKEQVSSRLVKYGNSLYFISRNGRVYSIVPEYTK